MRTFGVLIVLCMVAAPLAAQSASASNWYDAGSFLIELPRGIHLARTEVVEHPAMRRELFTAADPEYGAVLVVHVVMTGWPSDPALRTAAGARQLMGDTARMRAALESPSDTGALRRSAQQTLSDTSLATRRALLADAKVLISQTGYSRAWTLGQMHEIVTDNRVTLRSPITMTLDAESSLVGMADISYPRRGPAELWIVAYMTETRTAESDAIAVRMLDSFRVIGGPTTPPRGDAP